MQDIYQTAAGDALLDPARHPPAMLQYLRAERELLLRIASGYGVIVEAGCANGRHAADVLGLRKGYIGIDRVQRYLLDAAVAWPAGCFLQADLSSLPVEAILRKSAGRSVVLLFPFNVFGTLRDPVLLLQQLAVSRLPFVIFTFANTVAAIAARVDYFCRSGHAEMKQSIAADAVSFQTASGIHSVAYSEGWFREKFDDAGLAFFSCAVGEIGTAFGNVALERCSEIAKSVGVNTV